LVEKIGLKVYLLGWVSHTLTSELRRKGVEFAGQLLGGPEQQQKVDFLDIVTGDESWFLQPYNHQQIRCLSADEVLTRVARTIAALRTMLTVFGSIQGAYFIDWFPPGENATEDTSVKILEPLCQVLHSTRGSGLPRPTVHFDNAAPHRSTATEYCFQSCQFRHAD
jgi:hypothetical protein